MSRSVAQAFVGALLGVLVLGGCASSGSESAAPSSPSSSPVKTLTMLPAPEKTLSGELTAELQQSSRDVALGRFQVWITNGLQEEIRPRRIVYRDALLTKPVEGERLRAIPWSYRGYPLELIEPTCGGEEAGATVTVFYGGESVEIQLHDETQVVAGGRRSAAPSAHRTGRGAEVVAGHAHQGSGRRRGRAVQVDREHHRPGRVLHDRHRQRHPGRLHARPTSGFLTVDAEGQWEGERTRRSSSPAQPARLRHRCVSLRRRRDDTLPLNG